MWPLGLQIFLLVLTNRIENRLLPEKNRISSLDFNLKGYLSQEYSHSLFGGIGLVSTVLTFVPCAANFGLSP